MQIVRNTQASPPAAEADVRWAELEQLLDDSFPASGVPGVALGLWWNGAERYLVRGVTNVDAPVPVDERTLFQVGSTGKTYTALAVMRLVEQKVLDLDVPVQSYVPELRLADTQVAEQITLRHLLTHTGGQEGDLFDDFGGGDDCLSRFAAAMDQLPQLAPVGTWTYSNAGFSLAGRVLESVSGLTYERVISQLILEPLGHSHSVFGADAAITHRVAVGHRPGPDAPVVTRPWPLPRTVWPAGGLVSSVRDQIAYARFHLGDGTGPDGTRLVSAETLAYMRTPLATAGGGRASAVGLAWLLQPTPGVIAHGGSANGQESSFVIVPEKDFAITVLTNGSAGARLHAPLVKWAIRNLAGVESVKPVVEPGDPEARTQYVGRFASLFEELVVEGGAEGLTLTLQPTAAALRHTPDETGTGPMPLEVFADDRVLVAAGDMRGARGEFVRDESGAVRWLRVLGRLHRLG
jgi:CubicO group peptidase (beta-lactamase class C family)